MAENENLDVLKQHMEIVGKEREEQKKLLYDKLYRFLSIDLTIFPIITAIFFVYLTINYISSLLSFISFFIGVFYKFVLILFKLKSFITPTTALDGVNPDQWEKKLIFFVKEKADEEDKYYQELIRYVNHCIVFTMTSITTSLTSLFQYYLLQIPFIPEIVIFTFIIVIDLFFFITAIFYLKIVNNAEIILLNLKKLIFWRKKD